MKVIILAGGRGTRLAEETSARPKPMVEIGGRPILWHIMKHYAHHGFREFYVPVGYKGDKIKSYFLDYASMQSDLTVKLRGGAVTIHPRDGEAEDWTVHVIDTGLETQTGGRLRKLCRFLDDGPFMLTYGDGVSSVPLDQLAAYHKKHGKVATITAVRPPARFGGLVFDGDLVSRFDEKPQIGEGWINGGFMVLEPKVFDYIEGDLSSLEAEALTKLASDKQLVAMRHEGFWQCMDTPRELRLLERLWDSGKAPWRTW